MTQANVATRPAAYVQHNPKRSTPSFDGNPLPADQMLAWARAEVYRGFKQTTYHLDVMKHAVARRTLGASVEWCSGWLLGTSLPMDDQVRFMRSLRNLPVLSHEMAA